MRTFLYFFLLFSVILISNPLIAKDLNSVSLASADSLYEQKKYKQAAEAYEQLEKQGYSSPKMLLKMAFIFEEMKKNSKALYCLQRYYELDPSEAVLLKMRTLADENQIEGYSYGDSLYFRTLILQYRYLLLPMGIVLVFIVFGWVFTQYQKTKVVSVGLSLLFFFCILFLVFINQLQPKKAIAIVESAPTPLYEGPSAASTVLTLVKPGTLVEIEKESSPWLFVRTGDQSGYIKSAHLLTFNP